MRSATLSPAWTTAASRAWGAVQGTGPARAQSILKVPEPGTCEILRPQIDVQRQGGNDTPAGLGLEGPAREAGRRGQSSESEPEEMARTQPPGGTERGQGRQQRRRQAFAQRVPPPGQS